MKWLQVNGLMQTELIQGWACSSALDIIQAVSQFTTTFQGLCALESGKESWNLL